MENIYSQTESERNSIVQIPDGFASKCGNTLYSWLGTLWRGQHMGDEMVRGLQSSRGIILAQMYLDAIEALKLQDRNGAPVFHRELWHPIVIRLKQRDKSPENVVSLGGDDKNIGPQPEGSAYGEGTEFKIGEMAGYENLVAYPVDADIAGGALSIVDNIVNPTVVLERGSGYEIRNGAIIFQKENDPMADGSPFERFDVPIANLENPEDHDIEAVLWASDVLIDKNYVSYHLSYALGANAPSSDVVKRIVNSAWSSVASGLTQELVRTLMAAMLNVPVIQNEQETVIDITQDVDDEGRRICTLVRTDKGDYRISPKARLRAKIKSGAVLTRGELLDESVRIYPFLNNVTTQEVVVRPEVDRYSDWVIDLDGLPEGGYYVDASTIHHSGEEWEATVRDPTGDFFQFYSEPGYDSADALEVKFYSDLIDDAYFSITRRVIHEDPIYRVDADAGTDFSVPLTMDIPSVTVPSSMIRARTEYGVYAMWDLTEIKRDPKGRLYFDIGGQESDVKAFWEDIWAKADEMGTDLASILGPVGTKISPAAFFLRNLVGANTLFVVVDMAQVDDASMMRNPMFFDMLTAVVPSAIRLFLVEHGEVGEDVMDMGTANERESLSAALPEVLEGFSCENLPGLSGRGPSFGESVSFRFVRPSPAKSRVRKEEEE